MPANASRIVKLIERDLLSKRMLFLGFSMHHLGLGVYNTVTFVSPRSAEESIVRAIDEPPQNVSDNNATTGRKGMRTIEANGRRCVFLTQKAAISRWLPAERNRAPHMKLWSRTPSGARYCSCQSLMVLSIDDLQNAQRPKSLMRNIGRVPSYCTRGRPASRVLPDGAQ
jgi:hypothetical protein